ncbi:hypothetical protein ACHAWX_003597 [Stephanocyclus meneghinianus]
MDDTFDEDESLLVSPPPTGSGSNFFNESAANDSDQSCCFGNANNSDDLLFDGDGGNNNASNQSFSESSDSSDAHTPVKPKFSYASAMDALDDLVPSAMKTRRRATMFSLAKSSSAHEQQAAAENEIDVSIVNSPSVMNDTSLRQPETHDVFCSGPLDRDVGEDATVMQEHLTYHLSVPSETTLNIHVPNTTIDAPSVFRYPCIRRYDLREDGDLVLKRGHRIHESFNDEVDKEGMLTKPSNLSSCMSQERTPDLGDISMEVEHDKDGPRLDSRDIIDSINVHVDKDDPLYIGTSFNHEEDVSDAPGNEGCDSTDALNEFETVDVKKRTSYHLDNDDNVTDALNHVVGGDDRNTNNNAWMKEDEIIIESVCINESHHLFNIDEVISLDDRISNQLAATSSLMSDEKSCQSTERECNFSKAALVENTAGDLDIKSPYLETGFRIKRSNGSYAKSNLLESSHTLDRDLTYPELPRTSDDEEQMPSSFRVLSETLSPIAKSFSPRICDDTNEHYTPDFSKLNNASRSGLEPTILNASLDVNGGRKVILDGAGSTEADFRKQSCDSNDINDSSSGLIFDILSLKSDHQCERIDSSGYRGVHHAYSADDNYEQDKTTPRLAQSPIGDQSNNENTGAGDNLQALDDLTTFQNAFNSTSNALLQRLRGAAETRKREVTRRRYSLERKQQIMLEEKDFRTSMPTVTESLSAAPPRTSMPSKPRTKIEGLDPFKPFRARPMPSTTLKTERSHNNVASVHVPQVTAKASSRKKLQLGEDPYKPFKALPLPATHVTRQPNSSIGTKRKSSIALRPHHEQNKSSVKPSALHAKPPTRLLSGEDASIAKQISQRNRIEKEDEKIRRQSVFKARPMPSSIVSSGLIGERIIIEVSDKENNATSQVCSQKRQSLIQPFTPHSTRRAEERAAFECERAEREKANTQERRKRRTDLIAQTKVEIDELKSCIR